MTLRPGEEFRSVATPSQELLRRLAYLAAHDNDSVLTGGIRSVRDAFRVADNRRGGPGIDLLLQLTRLADPAYQAASARINEKLDSMDEASVMALQDIERELRKLRLERERMLEQAYRDEQGRLIFMTADGARAHYEDGTQVDDETFALITERLQGKPTWESWQDLFKREDELTAERDQIHRHDAARGQLRDDLAQGRISQEEAERQELEIEQTVPERMRRSYDALRARSLDEEITPDDTQQPPLSDPEAPAGPAAGPASFGPR